MKTRIWILAMFLSLAAALYQHTTNSTSPLIVTIKSGIQKIQFEYLRSYSSKGDCPIVIQMPDITISGSIYYRKFGSSDDMTKINLRREGEQLIGSLPHQPPTGKLVYRIELLKNGEVLKMSTESSIIIQFTGHIPDVLFVMYLILMFLTLLFSNVTGLLALFNTSSYKIMSLFTLISLIIGGLILGLIVQKYAFNEYWTGIPFGWSLDANKTLVAISVWAIVLGRIRHSNVKFWILTASLITLTIFTLTYSLI